MSGGLLTDLANVLRAAGCVVVEYDGWQSRARSGGSARYPSEGPWAVYWHHTASDTSPANDASYMCHGSGDRPVANLLMARDGAVWVLAAGPTNTNGKGGPHTLPDGRTVPLDSANSRVIGMEIANNGVGQAFPAAQIDACFRASTALCDAYRVRPDNVVIHQVWAPSRKIDPATASAVQGAWRPDSTTSSGTWSLGDVRAECLARAGGSPPPTDPNGDDELNQDQANELHQSYLNSEWTWAAVQPMPGQITDLDRRVTAMEERWSQSAANEAHATYQTSDWTWQVVSQVNPTEARAVTEPEIQP